MRLTLTILLGSLALSHGYYLDKSCASYQTFITKVMKSSFDLAQAGLDTFNSPSTVPNKLQAQKDLIAYMFNATRNSPDHKKTVVDKFEAVLKFSTTSDGSPKQILSVNDQKVYPTLNSKELIIFCNYDRFGAPKNGVIFDSLMKYYTRVDAVFTSCKTGGDDAYLAWTEASSVENKASLMQLCPWWLADSSSALTLADLAPDVPTKEIAEEQGTTEMDLMHDLADLLILHELTHGITILPTIDVDGGESYGWKNSRSFSDKGIINNADNYGFHGLGARMISPEPGTKAIAKRPMEDGSIEVLK